MIRPINFNGVDLQGADLRGAQLSSKGISKLSNRIVDAAWRGNQLFTLPAVDESSEIQEWSADDELVRVYPVKGTPLRLFSVAEGLLVISSIPDKLQFSILKLESEE